MNILQMDDSSFQAFMDSVAQISRRLAPLAKPEDLAALQKLIDNFHLKTADFFREERKLNIGVVGQVKAGKSSFLNTLLFGGQEILPKASTPKTATLTKMEYAEENRIQVEYYTEDEWELLEENASVELEDEIYTSARELVSMAQRNGIDPHVYLKKKVEDICFATYEDLIAHLNDYVGEDGTFTPIVKAVTLFLHKEEFEGLSIVDTPGLNDPIASRTIRTKEFMEVCDVVFFLSQSGSFLDMSDWVLLSSQLPQKGVKKLVLVASKYDSGVRDILRAPSEDDDIFGEDENTASTIPKACDIIRRKLRRRAKTKVEEFARDLEQRGGSPELIEVIRGCARPVFVSAIACNMSTRDPDTYSKEERNIYAALKKFSKDIVSDLALLGNFDEVREIFHGVAVEKEEILERKARGFLPTAAEELRVLLGTFQEKAQKRVAVLAGNDRVALLAQKDAMSAQIEGVKVEIAELFGDMAVRLEEEKTNGVRELREASKGYIELREHTGTKTQYKSCQVSDSKWYNPFSWGKGHTEHYTYTEQYTYCIASDVIDNLRKYAADAVNQVEAVFTDALQLKELKRRLLNVVIHNFDTGSEKYDAALFRIMVEEVISAVEFPVFSMDMSEELDSIAGKFTGELTSASERTELSKALATAIGRIYDELCKKLADTGREFKESMNAISAKIQGSLLAQINQEFEMLLAQCENRDREIADYQAYIQALEAELKGL